MYGCMRLWLLESNHIASGSVTAVSARGLLPWIKLVFAHSRGTLSEAHSLQRQSPFSMSCSHHAHKHPCLELLLFVCVHHKQTCIPPATSVAALLVSLREAELTQSYCNIL